MVHAKCGSVHMRLIPAPRGTGIVAAPVPKKILNYAGYEDVYTSAKGCTATLGNFAKATFQAIAETSSYLSPELWKEEALAKTPIELHTQWLKENHTSNYIREAQEEQQPRHELSALARGQLLAFELKNAKKPPNQRPPHHRGK